MDNSIARFQISADEDFRIQFVFVGLPTPLAGRALSILVKERASNVLRTTLTLGAGLTLDGTDTVTALVPQATASAWAKGEFETDLHDITGGANTRLVGARTLYDLPGKLPYGVIGAKATVQWVVNKAIVTAIGGIGPTGPANTLTIGTVETLPAGSPATAEITGAAPGQTLNLGIPTGAAGNIGPAGTIAVGIVTTGAPGSSVVVTNVGTPENAILNFTIPEGGPGIQGLTGNKGWSPAFAIVSDGARRVLRVSDWVGGEGVKPAAGDYVGAAGLTPTIGDAIDIRGPAGSATIPDGNKGHITTEDGGDTWTINGGYVPKTGGDFTGSVGVSGAAGTYRAFDFKTGTSLRWRLNADNQAEAGSNAGSDFAIARFDDAGAYIENAFRLGRADGVMYLPHRPNWGATPYDTTNLVAFTGDSGTGGAEGLVPEPAAGDANKVLTGAGVWAGVALPLGYLHGLKLEQDAGDPGNDIIVRPGSARDSGDARNLVLTVDCVKQIDVVFAEYTTPGTASGGRSSSDNLTGAKWFHVFVIGGSGKNTQPFFATSLSPILPTGFTEWRRVGSIYWNGSNIRSFRQVGRTFYFTNPNTLDIDTATLGTAATNYTVTTPTGLKMMAVLQVMSSHATVFTGVYIRDPDAADLTPSSTAAPLASVGAGGGTVTNGEIHVMTNTASQVRASAANSSTTLKAYAKGWVDEV